MWCSTVGTETVRSSSDGTGLGRDGGTEGLTAGDVQQGAVDGGHPQVGGAGVEDHGEGLGGRPQADLPVVLSLLNNRETV